MKIIITFIVFFSTLNLVLAGPKHSDKSPDPDATEFGKMETSPSVLSLSEVVSNYEDHKGKVVTFEAIPKKVCEAKGCWMVLEDGEYQVRTLFKDYGFFVPKNILGKKVLVQGVMEKKHQSAATIRHFMKDEGKKLEEIEKVKTGRVTFQFVASGVQIKKG